MPPRLPCLALTLLTAGLAGAALAQTPRPAAPAAQASYAAPVEAAERVATIEALARTLEADFVFPEVGKRYAAMLRAHLAAGAYDLLVDPVALGKQVTADLQAVSPDKHLRFAPAHVFEDLRKAMDTSRSKTLGPALEETKMIGDVAYLRFNRFPQDPSVGIAAKAFLLAHAGETRAVVIDSRPNHGGDPEVMNGVLSLLFATPTTLVRMDTRSDSAPLSTDQTPDPYMVHREAPAAFTRYDHLALPDPAETRLRTVPVYYLVSSRTGSAAEHIAMAFRHTRRALVIGETTAGYGHYGAFQPIGTRFSAFIPVGRTYDPDTDQDWEGVGVTPDVAVPAAQALDEALRRARAAGAHPDEKPA